MIQKLKNNKNLGPILVSISAALWATDALIRYPAIQSISPTWIVLVEHVLAVIIILPWILYHHKEKIFNLNKQEWLSSIYCGLGGSALGTVLFTSSFAYTNPSIAVLLQKLQPVFVVIFAYLVLNEKPDKKFFVWGWIALCAAIVLSFPDLDFSFIHYSSENKTANLNSLGVWLALCAAILWALSTVIGKVLLERTPVLIATFWRFFFGCIGLILVAFIGYFFEMPFAQGMIQWDTLFVWDSLFVLLYLSLIPGILAMIVYYKGLAKTPASVSTFIELLYPIVAVLLNTLILGTPLSWTQAAAGLVLMLTIAKLSF